MTTNASNNQSCRTTETPMRIAATIAAVIALATPVSATPMDNDFIVVVGSYSLRLRDEAAANLTRVQMAASRCGYTLRHTSSSRIGAPRPMIPGRIIHYVG